MLTYQQAQNWVLTAFSDGVGWLKNSIHFFIIIPGKHNIIADALSCLETSDPEMPLETDMFSIMPDDITAGKIFAYSLAHNEMEAFVIEDEEEIY